MIVLHHGLERVGFCVCIAAIAAALILLYTGPISTESGQADYRHYCAACYGMEGKGKGTWNGIAIPRLNAPQSEERREISFRGRFQSRGWQERAPMASAPAGYAVLGSGIRWPSSESWFQLIVLSAK